MPDNRKARYRDISDGLLRQRRNLLLISIIMPLFFVSGAAIETINIFGTVITIKNPEVIKYSIIILFGYFSLRYWQYYKEESYVQDMHRQMKQHVFHLEQCYLDKEVRKITDFLYQDVLSICYADPRYSMSGRFVAIPEIKDRVIFPFRRECEFYIYSNDRGYSDRAEQIKSFHLELG